MEPEVPGTGAPPQAPPLWPEAWQRRLASAEPQVVALATACDPVLRDALVLPLLAVASALQAGGPPPLLLLNGPVGIGKSTLGRLLAALAPLIGLRLAVASIDDLYLPLEQRRQKLAGNPFGVSRVPPGSHDLALLLSRLQEWRSSGSLVLPRFDKTLAEGQGDRAGEIRREADALVLEGWLMGCRPLGAAGLERAVGSGALALLSEAERRWLPRWDRELTAYGALWQQAAGLGLLRPSHWGLPYRWRLQAEARQRRAGGGWLAPPELRAMVRATLASLPPELYQDPLLGNPRLQPVAGPEAGACVGVFAAGPASAGVTAAGVTAAVVTGSTATDRPADTVNGVGAGMAGAIRGASQNAGAPEPSSMPMPLASTPVPLVGVVEADGRRRYRRPGAQLSDSSASSAIG
ncbi:MAG: hypothetical protein VKO65_01140 [Cyanobacteriota bacterium]|nr:hypothetical protein [Cyanobacteriota bacterium]